MILGPEFTTGGRNTTFGVFLFMNHHQKLKKLRYLITMHLDNSKMNKIYSWWGTNQNVKWQVRTTPNQSRPKLLAIVYGKWSSSKLMLINKHHPVNFIQVFQNNPSESASLSIGRWVFPRRRFELLKIMALHLRSTLTSHHLRGVCQKPSEDWLRLAKVKAFLDIN